jgi:hypothetical protein
MHKVTLSFLVAAGLLSAQVQGQVQRLSLTDQNGSPAQQQAPYEIQLSSKFAETLLIHKEEPACQKDPDGVKVSGTVVMEITIDKNGAVSRSRAFSGPKLLRSVALATVRKYRYKPYVLDKKPVEVETVVSIRVDCFFHTGQA